MVLVLSNRKDVTMKKILMIFTIALIASSAIAQDRGKVVATVNGENLYEDSVNYIYKEIPADNVTKLGGEEAVKKTIINQLVAAESLRQGALASGVDKDPEFQEYMHSEKERMIQEEFLRVESEKRVSEEDMKETYKKALADFKPETEYDIYSILNATKEDAEAVIKRLINGEKFEDLALKQSTASNVADTKGHIGFVKLSDLVDTVSNEISSLEKGEFSKTPVETPFGWNVFMLKDTKKEAAPTYEESKDKIRDSLYKKEMMNIINELKDKAKVEYK